MATFTERLAIIIDAQAGGAIRDINRLNTTLTKAGVVQDQTAQSSGFLRTKLDQLGLSGVSSGTLIAGGVAVGAAALTKFGISAVKASVDWANSVRLVQQATGATAETSSKLVAITDDYGISGEAAAKAFAKLGVNIANNKSILAEHNIQIVKNKDGTVDYEKTLLNVADAYKNTSDAAERDKIVLDAFGKSGRDLIPVLEQGRAGIQDLFAAVPKGQIFDQAKLDAARQFQLAMDNLKDSTNEVKFAIGNALIPVLTILADDLAGLIRFADELGQALAEITGVKIGGGLFKSLAAGPVLFHAVGTGLGLISEGSDRATEASKKLADAQKVLTQVAADDSHTHQELAKAQKNYRDAAEASAAISDKVGRAIAGSAREAHDAISPAQQLAEKTEAIANADWALLAAQDALSRSSYDLEGAQLDTEAAADRLQKVLADPEHTALEAAQAQHDLEGAIMRQRDAAREADKAQQELQGGFQDSTEAALVSRDELEKLKNKYPEMEPYIQGLIDKLNQIPGVKYTDWILRLSNETGVSVADLNALNVISTVTTFPGGAAGAIVTRPTLALIGEAGPEALVPLNRTPGSSPLPSAMGAVGDEYHFHYDSAPNDPVAQARLMERSLRATYWLMGR